MSVKMEGCDKKQSVVFFKHLKCTYRKFQSGVLVNETIDKVLVKTAYRDEHWIPKNKAIIVLSIPAATKILVMKNNPMAGFIEIQAAEDFYLQQDFYQMVPVYYPGVPETRYLAVSKLIFAQQAIDSLVNFGHAYFIQDKPTKGLKGKVEVKKEAEPKLKEIEMAEDTKCETCLVCRNSRLVKDFETCQCGERTCTNCLNKRPHVCLFCKQTGGFYRMLRQN